MTEEDRVVKLAERLDREPDDWRGHLARRGDRIIGDERNVLAAMRTAPELHHLIQFNTFALRVEFTRPAPWRKTSAGEPWTDEDDLQLQAWLQHQGIDVRARNAVVDSVPVVARDTNVHPVRKFLRGLLWDQQPRLENWLLEYLGATGPANYLTAVGARFLISAVARVMRPGCQVDHVLVLEGPQGIGKSRSARALAVRPDWFADSIPDLHGRDAALQLCGKWVIELAELAAVRRAELEGVKAFLSRSADVFRAPYARRTNTVERQSVFLATTNESEYLRDPTGNRRFWPVRCGRIDVDKLEAERDQLYAEAVTWFRRGEPWHLDAAQTRLAEIEQDERILVSELEVLVGEYLQGLVEKDIHEVTTRNVFVDALHLDPTDKSFADLCRRHGPEVANAMHRAGWSRVKTTGRGKTRRVLYRRGSQCLT